MIEVEFQVTNGQAAPPGQQNVTLGPFVNAQLYWGCLEVAIEAGNEILLAELETVPGVTGEGYQTFRINASQFRETYGAPPPPIQHIGLVDGLCYGSVILRAVPDENLNYELVTSRQREEDAHNWLDLQGVPRREGEDVLTVRGRMDRFLGESKAALWTKGT